MELRLQKEAPVPTVSLLTRALRPIGGGGGSSLLGLGQLVVCKQMREAGSLPCTIHRAALEWIRNLHVRSGTINPPKETG